MRLGLTLLLLACLGCKKAVEIQDPHFKELVGEWSTVNDTEKKSVVFSSTGKITVRHSAERGYTFKIDHFVYEVHQILDNGDTMMFYACYNKKNEISFFKKMNVDSIYTSVGEKINNQIVVGNTSLFVKTK